MEKCMCNHERKDHHGSLIPVGCKIPSCICDGFFAASDEERQAFRDLAIMLMGYKDGVTYNKPAAEAFRIAQSTIDRARRPK